MSVLIICFSCRPSVRLVGEIIVIDSNWSTLSFGCEFLCGLWKNLESGAFVHLFSVRTELQWTGNPQCVTLKGWKRLRGKAVKKKVLKWTDLPCLSFSVSSVASHYMKSSSKQNCPRVHEKGRVETPVKSKLGDWTAINLPQAVLYVSLWSP